MFLYPSMGVDWLWLRPVSLFSTCAAETLEIIIIYS